MKLNPCRLTIGVLALLAAQAAFAGDITVTDAWSRATIGTTAPGVAYLTITDSGAADTLTGIATPVAASAMLHQSTTENGVSSMHMVDALPVGAGATVKLAPGGYHIMLEGLKQPLKAGDTFPLTLSFKTAGAVTTTVTVRPLGADKPKDDTMGGMDMGHM
jgi:copper(I)-binding protein